MAISGVQIQNTASFYPQSGYGAGSTYSASGGAGDSLDLIGMNSSGSNSSGSFKSGTMNNSLNNQLSDNNKNNSGEVNPRATSLDDQLKKEKIEKQQKELSVERALRMTGIPLYGGVLVSVVKSPDGESQSYDALTGRRITSADLSWDGSRLQTSALPTSGTAEFGYYSQGLYNGMSAAEVYQKIQQMLGARTADIPWTLPGSGDNLPKAS
ncbi:MULTISPECIES: hypothetical protein [Dickeya]|uniref:Uncharacterized protein n=1 Tax=Dickeya aquatica TaxID=1401087 RepID=A0A375AES4_9GAMM|nr:MULTISPECIES: hypothetical protein [Dickeya]SLM64089.1 FIG00613357: hypothetical protein [Dickeya aquatica]